ncbi:hypothetical protein K445DRAFT_316366 [Daldinia sp. EC12]|nr:hypothetical protein K445DRAFT_316366 [Daldinia sp. EC12]
MMRMETFGIRAVPVLIITGAPSYPNLIAYTPLTHKSAFQYAGTEFYGGETHGPSKLTKRS